MESGRQVVLLLLPVLLLLLGLFLAAGHLEPALGAPLVSGRLIPWESPMMRHASAFARDPMPWEDGYFDPSYHAWPKSRQQQVVEKSARRLTSEVETSGAQQVSAT